VCVLLAGYDEAQVRASRLVELVGADSVVQLRGGHDAGGIEIAPLDEAAARAAILAQRDRVAAFAISSMFAVRNPTHELRLQLWVRELTARPVTCGHELAAHLGAPRRAMTAALNARLIPAIAQLIASVRQCLAARQMRAPLMMVKGDGSLVSADSALLRPVGTILSGPAASVLGACWLGGVQDAVVADMGGTTTDVAIVRAGHPEVGADAARVGDWQPMVDTVRVRSVGLGGDSEARFCPPEGIGLGPRRVLPLSLLAHQCPGILDGLRRQCAARPNARHNRFVMRLGADPVVLNQLPGPEQRAWDALGAGPLELDRVTSADPALARALARLERRGLAIYSGFTPTDAAHVLGLSGHWCGEAAELAARLWARQMREIYGLRRWDEGDARAASQAVFDQVVVSITHALVEAGLHDRHRWERIGAGGLGDQLARLMLEDAQAPDRQPVISARFAPTLPLLAVGAPASTYFPEVARRLRADLRVPRHAEAANAVGAVIGQVVQRVTLAVMQRSRRSFRVFGLQAPSDFDELAPALQFARTSAQAAALELARGAGADDPQASCQIEETWSARGTPAAVLMEARVTARACGWPDLSSCQTC
jgi:N-methylhydantoinase A/oxoprolinase/acetone carboxylase beta subunit